MGDPMTVEPVQLPGQTAAFPTLGVLAEVASERQAQDVRWGVQSHPDGTGADQGHPAELAQIFRDANEDPERITWQSILLEEVYEAMAESDPARLRAELLQAAAVIVAWVEAIDRRSDR